MARNYKYGKRSNAILNSGISQQLIDVCIMAQQIANKAHIGAYIPDWGYSSGFRTLDEQREMFNAGKSNCDGVLKVSNHQTGNAIDFYAYVDGKTSYAHEDVMPIITCHMQAAMELNVRINTGALFSTIYDAPHIELVV